MERLSLRAAEPCLPQSPPSPRIMLIYVVFFVTNGLIPFLIGGPVYGLAIELSVSFSVIVENPS